METTKQITGVKAILNIAKPIIVLQLAGFPDVARNPKQMLTDLQNSGRALDVTSVSDPRFIAEVHKLRGAFVTGDMKAFKAGDAYTVTENHPAVTDKNHPQYGKVNIGDKLHAEKDGVWVEGFLSIPRTEAELMRGDIAEVIGNKFSAMFGLMGMGSAAPAPIAVEASNNFVPEVQEEELDPATVGAGKPQQE